MHHDTLHRWRLHLLGTLHTVQGWLMHDRQRMQQGRYECLLAEIDGVRCRVARAAAAGAGPVEPVGEAVAPGASGLTA